MSSKAPCQKNWNSKEWKQKLTEKFPNNKFSAEEKRLITKFICDKFRQVDLIGFPNQNGCNFNEIHWTDTALIINKQTEPT